MNKFKWGNLNDPKVYVDPESYRNVQVSRANFGQLASALASEGKRDLAVKALDRCEKLFPDSKVIFDFSMYPVAEGYLNAQAYSKADTLFDRIMDVEEGTLKYNFESQEKKTPGYEKLRSVAIINQIIQRRLAIIENWYNSKKIEKANAVMEKFLNLEEQNLKYIFGLYPATDDQLRTSKQQTLSILQRVNQTLEQYKQETLLNKGKELFNDYLQRYQSGQ